MIDTKALDTTRCPYDQSDLLVDTDADEHGAFYFFVCKTGQHTFRAVGPGDGFKAGPSEQSPDFDEVEIPDVQHRSFVCAVCHAVYCPSCPVPCMCGPLS